MTTTRTTEDIELVAFLNQGDQKSFELIYRTYSSDLLRYACRRISSREDCEEIIQEIFVSLWSRWGSLEVENLQAYLLRAVKHKVIRYFQHSKVRKKYEEHYRLFDAVYDPFNEADKQIDPAAIHAMIDKSLPALPEKCQAAFRMRLAENLSNTEIAERMNVKKTTIEHYMVMALNHLRISYKEMQAIHVIFFPLFFNPLQISFFSKLFTWWPFHF